MPQKCLTMLEARNSLGHGSNQVHQSSTHTWHLRAFPTSMHRLSEPSSFSFGVLIRFLETSLMTHSVTSRNTLDHADSSCTVHMTFHTRHHLPAAPGHLSPIPRAWNLSPQFVSLFGPLPYVHFLSHLCLYVTYLFMIWFPLYPFVSPCPYVSASIPDPFV